MNVSLETKNKIDLFSVFYNLLEFKAMERVWFTKKEDAC